MFTNIPIPQNVCLLIILLNKLLIITTVEERDEHNKVLEELNRSKKSEKVDIPPLDVSIILRDPRKKLTNLESIKIIENAYNSISVINNKMKKS